MKHSMIAVLGLAAVMLAVGAAQATIVIDDFSDPADGWTDWYLSTNVENETLTKSATGLSGVYGGSRETTLTKGPNNSGRAELVVGDYFTTGAYNGGDDWCIGTWLYDGGGGAGGIGLDLTTGTRFSVDTWFDHVGRGHTSVMSWTLNDGSNTATVSKTWATEINPYGSDTQIFLFSDFLSVNPSLDLSSIDSIRVYLETDKAGDYNMSVLITDAVPEPATLGLLALGGVGLLARRRRGK